MEGERNFANIGRQTDVTEQNMQHFMSNSPWSGPLLIRKVLYRTPKFVQIAQKGERQP